MSPARAETAPGTALARRALVRLEHRTRYRYDRAVALGPHQIRLRPSPLSRVHVPAYALTVGPARHTVAWHCDAASNHVARVLFLEKTDLLQIEVGLTAELLPFNPFDFVVEPGAAHIPFRYDSAIRQELSPFLLRGRADGTLRRWMTALRPPRHGRLATVDFLVGLNQRVKSDVLYVERPEHGIQSPARTLKLGSGSCRDSSWLVVQALRHFGLAARFVSGYLVQLAGEGRDGAAGDRADLHAWAEVYVPGAGWLGLDPTSGLAAGESHIPLARAGAPALTAPVTGSVEPCRSRMDFELSVQRV